MTDKEPMLRQLSAYLKLLNEKDAEIELLKYAARNLIREIVFGHPAATGFTVLLNHEPLYALALLVNGECITREGEKRSANEDHDEVA